MNLNFMMMHKASDLWPSKQFLGSPAMKLSQYLKEPHFLLLRALLLLHMKTYHWNYTESAWCQTPKLCKSGPKLRCSFPCPCPASAPKPSSSVERHTCEWPHAPRVWQLLGFQPVSANQS